MKPTLVDLMRAADDLEEVVKDIDFLLADDEILTFRRVLAVWRAYIDNERK